jgi:hypothetical protein
MAPMHYKILVLVEEVLRLEVIFQISSLTEVQEVQES